MKRTRKEFRSLGKPGKMDTEEIISDESLEEDVTSGDDYAPSRSSSESEKGIGKSIYNEKTSRLKMSMSSSINEGASTSKNVKRPKQSITSKNVSSLIATSTKHRSFEEQFDFTFDEQKTKFGICKICKIKHKTKKIKMKGSNTSGLKKHLLACHKSEYEKLFPEGRKSHQTTSLKQQSLIQAFKGRSTSVVPLAEQTEEDFQNVLVDWLARKYLPFNFFDDDATQNFFCYLNPTHTYPRRKSLKDKVTERFKAMQASVMTLLKKNPSRISFTVDGWTSIASKSYYGITAHFIDDDWLLQSLVLDFIPSNGLHTGKDIANLFYKTLLKFGIHDKIQGITVDNASANTTFMDELAKLIPDFDKENCHFRCFAHILNLAVQDVMKLLIVDETSIDVEEEETDSSTELYMQENTTTPINKIRTQFAKIKRSEQLKNKLKSACDTTGTEMVSPKLDVRTRWNSTHDMLDIALQLQKCLNILCDNNDDLKNCRVSDFEWNLLKKLFMFLRNFKILSTRLGGEKYATLPLVVVSFNLLLDKVESTIKELDENPDRNTTDETLLIAFQAARDKMIKHYKLTNWMYCAVLILDPRHKLETFQLTKWGREMQEASLAKFTYIMDTYSKLLNPPITTQTLEHSQHQQVEMDTESSEDKLHEEDDILNFNILFHQKSKPTTTRDIKTEDWKQEFDNYTSAGRCDANEDILVWWKNHQETYPTLAAAARDLFSVTATSVPSERMFSKASIILRKHRNRLDSESARSQLCLNSWVTCSLSEKLRNSSKPKSCS